MKTCNTSFLLRNGLLFCNESDRGNRVVNTAHYFWAEGSDKGPSAQYLRPNLQPIYRQFNSTRKQAFSAQGLSQKLISQLHPDLSQLIFVVGTQRL
jgi:hypothetical protein